MYDIVLAQQQPCQIGPVLARYASDERNALRQFGIRSMSLYSVWRDSQTPLPVKNSLTMVRTMILISSVSEKFWI
jgi:hypothetical protein